MPIDYKVKWHEHDSAFFRCVESFCSNQILTDVTISCDQRDFQAHKLVLSVYSGYFHRLFSIPAANPAVVCLKDVPARHMELLLAFMYKGEIYVKSSEMKDFLETAINLEVSGLAQVEHTGQPEPKTEHETEETGGAQSATKRRKIGDTSQIPTETPFSPSHVNLETPSPSPPRDQAHGQQFKVNQMQFLEAMAQSEDHGPASSSTRQSLTSADRPSKYLCQFCDRNFNDRWRLNRHTVSHTGEQRFTCKVCNKKFSTHDSCVRHLRNMHKYFNNFADLVTVAKATDLIQGTNLKTEN